MHKLRGWHQIQSPFNQTSPLSILGPHYQAYVTMLNGVIFKRGALGSLLVVGINQGDEEEEDKEFSVDQGELTSKVDE